MMQSGTEEVKTESKHTEIDFGDDCSTSEELLVPLSTFNSKKSNNEEYKCAICQRICANSRGLSNHMYVHRPDTIIKEKKIPCDICGKEFLKLCGLNSHRRRHTEKRPHKCEICSKEFRTAALLMGHMRNHAGEKVLSCKFCEKQFIQNTSYITHLRVHTGEKPYKCNFCKKKFSQRYALNWHELIHTAKPCYTCNLCFKQFHLRTELNVHMQSSHQNAHKKTQLYKGRTVKEYHNNKKAKQTSSKVSTAEVVRVKSERESGSGEEGEIKSEEKTEGKTRCLGLKQLKTEFPLEVPVTYDAGLIKQEPPDTSTKGDSVFILPDNPSPEDLGSKTYYCNFCKHQYINEHMFTKHMKIHLDEGFTCDTCGERFPYKIDLRIHMRKHAGRETYPCRICHKLYLSKSHLDVHFRTHTGEKPFPCGICNAKFRARGSLNIHMASHDRQGKAVPSLTPGNALSYE